MSTATKSKPQTTKTPTIDIESILESVEALAERLPQSQAKIAERRDSLARQLEHAKAQLKLVDRMPERKREAERAKWTAAVERHEAELANLPEFNEAERRDAALEVLAMEEDLKICKATIGPRWDELTQLQLKRCLGAADFAEHEKTSALVVRLNAALRLAARLRQEISTMVPRELLDERAGLEELLAASANLRTGPATSDAVHRARTWASDELKRLNEAAVSLSWTELESYTVSPL